MDAKLHGGCRGSASSTRLPSSYPPRPPFFSLLLAPRLKNRRIVVGAHFSPSNPHTPHHPKNRAGPLKWPFLHLPLGAEPRISPLSFFFSSPLYSLTGGCLRISIFRSNKEIRRWLQIYMLPPNIVIKITIIEQRSELCFYICLQCGDSHCFRIYTVYVFLNLTELIVR